MRGHRHPDAIVLEIGNRLQKQLEFSADKVFVGNPRLFCYKLYGVLRTKVFFDCLNIRCAFAADNLGHRLYWPKAEVSARRWRNRIAVPILDFANLPKVKVHRGGFACQIYRGGGWALGFGVDDRHPHPIHTGGPGILRGSFSHAPASAVHISAAACVGKCAHGKQAE